MGSTKEINRRSNLRNQVERNERSGFVGDPYFNAARKSIQSGFRFLLRVRGVPFALVSEVSRPTPAFGGTKEFQLLNWKFKYPSGVVSWNDVSFTLREIYDNSVIDSISGILMKKYKLVGHDNPLQIDPFNLKDMSKSSLMASLGDVRIDIIDPEGDVYEQWRLYGAFVSSINFSGLNYSATGLLGSTMSISYDWATLTYTNDNGVSKTY